MDVPSLSYLDDIEIDDLWMRLKRDGIPAESIRKAEAELSGKLKVGFGHLISWIAGDLSAEGGGKITRESAVTTTYAAPYRLLLLLELLPSIKRISLEDHANLAAVPTGDFVEIDCASMELALLPQLGDYWHLVLGNEEPSDAESMTPQEQRETVSRIAERFSTLNRAFSFWARLQAGSPQKHALARLNDDYNDALLNLMSLCENNFVLGTSLAIRPEVVESPKPAEPESKEGLRFTPEEVLGPALAFRLSTPEQRREMLQKNEMEKKRRQEEKVATRLAKCDALIVTCFNQAKMKANLGAMSTIGRTRLFGRVLWNVLADESSSKFGTRMLGIYPITLAVGQPA